VVVRLAPFQRTTEDDTKLLPLTVSVNAAPPAVALVGESELRVGEGFEAALIVNVCAPDVPPPGAGVNTVTDAVPAVAMSAAEIAAWSCVALTKAVVRADPFQRTTEVATKLLPVTVRVKLAPPAIRLLGESALVPGKGLLTVNVRAPDVPPPGAGVNTVTDAVPAVAMSLARMAAVSWVLLTNVVVRLAPFHRTTEPATKLLPVAVSVNPAPPAVRLLGASELSTGAGLGLTFATVTLTEALVPTFPVAS
jgi:hypothetical protein